MLRTIVFGLVAAAASTNALWLAVANADGETNAGGGIYGSPYCLVGKGDTQEEALSKATDFVNGNIIIAGGHCVSPANSLESARSTLFGSRGCCSSTY